MPPLPAALTNDPQVVAYLDRRIRDAVTVVMVRSLAVAFAAIFLGCLIWLSHKDDWL